MSLTSEAAIQQLRKELGTILSNDPEANTEFCLKRFFDGASGDYKEFKSRVERNLQFRRQNYKEAKASDYKALAQKVEGMMEMGVYHHARDGTPVIFQKFKKFDPSTFDGNLTLEDLGRAMINSFERRQRIVFPIASETVGRKICKNIVVIDMEGIPLLKIMNSKYRDFAKFGSTFASANYPELLEAIYIINAPVVFKAVFSIVSLWLDERTKRKIIVRSDNGESLFKSMMDEKHIPTQYGGKCTAKLSDHPGPWQEEFWQSVEDRRFTMSDRSLETKWFFTKQEAARLANPQPGDLYF